MSHTVLYKNHTAAQSCAWRLHVHWCKTGAVSYYFSGLFHLFIFVDNCSCYGSFLHLLTAHDTPSIPNLCLLFLLQSLQLLTSLRLHYCLKFNSESLKYSLVPRPLLPFQYCTFNQQTCCS